jgi:nucleoside-diphosphate-sugar epimerase
MAEPQLVQCCRFPAFEAVRGDAGDRRLLDDLVPRVDCVIPLAALIGAPLCKQDPMGATTTNRDAVLELVKRIRPAQMILIPTTNPGYGAGEKDKFCTEETPLRPISLYGTTKVEAERAVRVRPRWPLDRSIEEVIRGYRMLRNGRYANV